MLQSTKPNRLHSELFSASRPVRERDDRRERHNVMMGFMLNGRGRAFPGGAKGNATFADALG